MKRIEFFDCSNEVDLQKAESLLKTKTVVQREVVQFPYLMLIWEETI